MRTLTTALNAELLRTDGAGFRWLVVVTPKGGTPRHLCADPQIIGAITYTGQLLGISPMYESSTGVGDLTLEIADNPANRAAVVLAAEVTISLWPVGKPATDATILFYGEISDPTTRHGGKITADAVSFANLGSRMMGTPLSLSDYPGADPDAVGRIMPIIYGSVNGSPCLPVDSGSITSLQDPITATASTANVSDTAALPAAGIIQMDIEQISYTGKTATSLIGLTRGINGTTASPHDKGSAVAEVQTQYDYLVADHPVKAITAVYVDGVKQHGADFAMFLNAAGRSFVRFYTWPTIERNVNLGVVDSIGVADSIVVNDGILVNDGITVNDGIVVVDGINVSDTVAISDTTAVSASQTAHAHSYDKISSHVSTSANVYIAPLASYMIPWAGGISVAGVWTITMNSGPAEFWSGGLLRATFPSQGGTISVEVTADNPIFSHIKSTAGIGNVQFGSASLTSSISTGSGNAAPGITSTKTGTVSRTGGVSKVGSVSRTGSVSRAGSVSKTGTVSRTGSVSKTGTVTLTGNSVADTKIGGLVTVDVQGWADDGAGSITGAAGALIERPDHVVRHVLINYGSVLPIRAASVDFANYGADRLAIHLSGNTTPRSLIADLARQTGSTIAFSGDRWLMRSRQTVVPAINITDADIIRLENGASTIIEASTGLRGLKNRHRWRCGKKASGNGWEAADVVESISSQGLYDVREEIVDLPYVPNAAQASALVVWLALRGSNPYRKIITLQLTLKHYALEVGDKVSIYSSKAGVNMNGEIINIGPRNLSGKNNGSMTITVEEF